MTTCRRDRRNSYPPHFSLSLSLYTHAHMHIYFYTYASTWRVVTTVHTRKTQLLPTWSLPLSLHTHTHVYISTRAKVPPAPDHRGHAADTIITHLISLSHPTWFLSLSTHTYIYIHTFLYIQRAGNYVKRGNLRYVKIWKLLHTRQEVYHPLQEVCPLDRANLQRANLE